MKQRSEEGAAVTALILETFKFNGALLAAGNQLTKDFGLTSARWQVMGAVELAKQPLTVSQISKEMGLSRQAIQRIINDLKELGFVNLLQNPQHKRAPLVSLSSDAETVMKKVDSAQIDWVNKLSEGMSNESVKTTTKMLCLLRKRLEQPD